MKKLLMLVVMLVVAVVAMAQTSNKISYQAVVRDANNRLVASEPVDVKVTITYTGTHSPYTEEFSPVQTNQNGLISLLIGDGAYFDEIDWNTVTTIKTEITVGSTTLTSEVPVTAVPFALYASDVNPAGGTVAEIYAKIKADSLTVFDTLHTYYYTQTQVDAKLAEYTKTAEIPALIKDQISDTADNVRNEVTAKLADYTKTAEIPALIKDQISDTADNVRNEVTAKLAEYTKTAEIPALIKDQISDTADNVRNEVTAKLAEYTKTAEIPALIKDQISDTADNVRNEVTAKLADYVKTAELPDAIKGQIGDTANVVRKQIADTAKVLREEIADAQVKADWAETDNTKKSYIENKPSIIDTIKDNVCNANLTLKKGSETYTYNALNPSCTEITIELDSLTTAAIVRYIGAADATDVDAIYDAVHTNIDFAHELIQKVVAAAESHEQEALDVALYYFNHISTDQIRTIVTSANVSHFIDELNGLTSSDLTNLFTALSSSTTAQLVGKLVKALGDNINASQAQTLINEVLNNIDASQVDVLINAINNAATTNPTGAAAQLKARLDAHINALIDAKINQHNTNPHAHE